MKFSELPYKRVDMEETKKEFLKLMEVFDAAESGEEQFEIHKKYYELTEHFNTAMTLAEIRHDIDMSDEFYTKESDYYDENRPIFQSLAVE